MQESTFSNYDTTQMIILVIIILCASIAFFLIIRWFVLWYYKINQRTQLLEEIKAYLMFIAREKDPAKFDAFEQKWRNVQQGMIVKPIKLS